MLVTQVTTQTSSRISAAALTAAHIAGMPMSMAAHTTRPPATNLHSITSGKPLVTLVLLYACLYLHCTKHPCP